MTCPCTNKQVYVNYAQLEYEGPWHDSWLEPASYIINIRYCRLVCTECKKVHDMKATSRIVSYKETGPWDTEKYKKHSDICDPEYEFDETTESYIADLNKYEFKNKYFVPILQLEPDFIRTWNGQTMSDPCAKEVEMYDSQSKDDFYTSTFYTNFHYDEPDIDFMAEYPEVEYAYSFSDDE